MKLDVIWPQMTFNANEIFDSKLYGEDLNHGDHIFRDISAN